LGKSKELETQAFDTDRLGVYSVAEERVIEELADQWRLVAKISEGAAPENS
jgi:hypothetical protein